VTTLPGSDKLPIGSGPARDVRKETTMLETTSRHWWAVALRGVAAILFGVLALVWPGITVFALVLVFGAYALVDGALTLVVLIGIAAVAFGITLLMLGLRLRGKRRHGPAAAGHHHRPVTA
jgi:uncharacterized membrane protein HdeD (DUF308 family)